MFFNGNLSELILYDRYISGADLSAVNAYLNGRYGIGTVELSTQAPTLSVAQTGASTAKLSWLPGYAGYVLEGRTNIASGVWSPIATPPPNNQVTVGTTNGARFFRLRGQ
jgi:hypothetical protein